MTELQIKVAKAWKATMKVSRLMAKSKDRLVRRKWREEASKAQANIKIALKDSSATQKIFQMPGSMLQRGIKMLHLLQDLIENLSVDGNVWRRLGKQ